MTASTKTRIHTFEDFCEIVQDGQKADLIDGVIYMASPDNTDANKINVWLCILVGGYVESKDLGDVFVSRVACRLDDWNGPEPDLLYLRKDQLHRVKRGKILGAPDLAVEIVSPDSVERDYHKKKQLYQEYGVREYWLIDEVQDQVHWFALDRTGAYKKIKPQKGILRSKVLPGFWVHEAWLTDSPRPKAYPLLQALLEGKSPDELAAE